MLACLHELTKQNTIQTGKKFSISILFQKICLGWKLSPTINRRGREGEVLGEGGGGGGGGGGGARVE